MFRFVAFLRTVLIVLLVTLFLDLVVSLFLPASTISNLAAAQSRDNGIYDLTVRYNHDLRPNLSRVRTWGADDYPFHTDAHGFRTGPCAGTDAAAERDRTVFVIGDSFTEGLGVAFKDTATGLLACAYQQRGLAVRNLGVAGYSPVIYHHKLRAAADRLALKPRHVVMFLDVSDIHNDAIDYVEDGGRVYAGKPTFERRAIDFLKRNLMSVSVVLQIRQRLMGDRGGSIARLNNELSRWTVRDDELNACARRGLDVTVAKSVDLCRQWNCGFTLVVYPWPDQVNAGDSDSIQVRYWRDWAARQKINFINAFEPFFREPKDDVLRKYFIADDVHWTAAGHRLIFDKVSPKLLR